VEKKRRFLPRAFSPFPRISPKTGHPTAFCMTFYDPFPFLQSRGLSSFLRGYTLLLELGVRPPPFMLRYDWIHYFPAYDVKEFSPFDGFSTDSRGSLFLCKIFILRHFPILLPKQSPFLNILDFSFADYRQSPSQKEYLFHSERQFHGTDRSFSAPDSVAFKKP